MYSWMLVVNRPQRAAAEAAGPGLQQRTTILVFGHRSECWRSSKSNWSQAPSRKGLSRVEGSDLSIKHGKSQPS